MIDNGGWDDGDVDVLPAQADKGGLRFMFTHVEHVYVHLKKTKHEVPFLQPHLRSFPFCFHCAANVHPHSRTRVRAFYGGCHWTSVCNGDTELRQMPACRSKGNNFRFARKWKVAFREWNALEFEIRRTTKAPWQRIRKRYIMAFSLKKYQCTWNNSKCLSRPIRFPMICIGYRLRWQSDTWRTDRGVAEVRSPGISHRTRYPT